MKYVLGSDFREKLQQEIDRLEGGIATAAEITEVSERSLRRVTSGEQVKVTEDLFDRIATAFEWPQWEYTIHEEASSGEVLTD